MSTRHPSEALVLGIPGQALTYLLSQDYRKREVAVIKTVPQTL